jgi:hypothetical protein
LGERKVISDTMLKLIIEKLVIQLNNLLPPKETLYFCLVLLQSLFKCYEYRQMKYTKILLYFTTFLFSILAASKVECQNSPNFIYSDSIFGIFLPESTLAALRPMDQCNDSVIVVSNEIFSSFDILVRPNGDVYGYGIRNGFFDKRFYRINLITGIAPISNASYLTLDTLAMGLTCDENGYLYLAGKGITKQTMLCCNYDEQYLGVLPPNMQCQGDITYRRWQQVGGGQHERPQPKPDSHGLSARYPAHSWSYHGAIGLRQCGHLCHWP